MESRLYLLRFEKRNWNFVPKEKRRGRGNGMDGRRRKKRKWQTLAFRGRVSVRLF